jgi:hypothetical protein
VAGCGSGQRSVLSSCTHDPESPGTVTGGQFLDATSEYYLTMTAQWSWLLRIKCTK